MEANPTQAATALLTEHLQYTPLSLIDDIIDSVNNFVYQGVGSLENGLYATPPERLGFRSAGTDASTDASDATDSDAKKEIEEGLHQLETLLNSTVDKTFDIFEIYTLRNILSVPPDLAPWVRLSHYDGLQYPIPADAPTPDTVQTLRQKLHASRTVNRALQRERQRNEAILSTLKSMTQGGDHPGPGPGPNLAFLFTTKASQTAPGEARQPLTTATTFTLSQLPALKDLSQELRQKLTLLRRASSVAGTAKDERREERRAYIEQRTKLHLERSGQVMADDAAAVADPGIDPGDLAALEQIAGTFTAN